MIHFHQNELREKQNPQNQELESANEDSQSTDGGSRVKAHTEAWETADDLLLEPRMKPEMHIS